MFGLTGDLGRSKLFPALYELAAAGRLGMPVIGVGRSEYSDDEIRSMFDEALADLDGVDDDVVASIDLSYLSGDSTAVDTYDRLADRLDGCRRPLVYAALPPHLFGEVASCLDRSRLPDATRLVVEKPFGEDADSARELYEAITSAVGADRLFIVDHFLAKAAIENMSVARHANALMENSLDRAHVERIDIEMSEAGGVDGRGSFYEGVGAVADVVQNHLMQTLTLVTMEAPDDDSDEAFGAAGVALLRAVRTVDPDDVVLGQYDGYPDLDDVADDSTVETFAAVTLEIDNDRWRGVPVHIRTGKRLADTSTAVTFTLRPTSAGLHHATNRIRFTIKPDASVAFDVGILEPTTHGIESRTVYACGPEDHGPLGDYATMFDTALDGEHRHFADIDGVVEAWRILAPIVESERSADDLVVYDPGADITTVG